MNLSNYDSLKIGLVSGYTIAADKWAKSQIPTVSNTSKELEWISPTSSTILEISARTDES